LTTKQTSALEMGRVYREKVKGKK